MKAHRVYRKYSDPAFPLHVMRYDPRRHMPSFIRIHWHAEPELLFAREGEYEIFDEDGNYLLHAGEVCILPPEKNHAIRSLQPRGEYWSISFPLELITMPDKHFFQQQVVAPLRAGTLVVPKKLSLDMAVTAQAVAHLETLCFGSKEQQFLSILAFWMSILPVCSVSQAHRNSKHGHSAVEACIQYMDTNYSSQITLSELAQHVHLHPNYLCAIFKRHAGVTVLDYLTQIRLRKAQQLLRKEDHTINQVAELCGFHDVDHFSKTFKAALGATPTAYRKAYSER